MVVRSLYFKKVNGVEVSLNILDNIMSNFIKEKEESTINVMERIYERLKRVSMGWRLLRLTVKILAFLRLTVNLFPLRLTEVKN